MNSKTLVAAGCATAIALVASAAFAQAPAAPAAPAVTHGAPVAGICVFSGDEAIGNSTVGKYVLNRLQQLQGQAGAEINAEKTAIDNDAKTIDGQRATLDQNTFEQRAAAVQVRANALNRKVQLRQAELQRTQEKALGRVGDELAPLVRSAYQAKGCSVLISKDALTLGLANPAMDLTPAVVTALNAKITQFAFDRERLDQPAPTAPAPAPAAAAPRK